jgi:SPX domain protein involved in polyphosphate accumulation
MNNRFECKYSIPAHLTEQIRAFIRPYVRPDPYAARRPGYRYAVTSLYFDSPALHLYHQNLSGERTRFKLRLRSYGNEASDPVWADSELAKNATETAIRLTMA